MIFSVNNFMTGRPGYFTSLYAESRYGWSAAVPTLVPTANRSTGAFADIRLSIPYSQAHR